MIINISRRRSIFLGLAIIALFFASGILMLYRAKPASKKTETLSDRAAEFSLPAEKQEPAVPVTLSKFQRNEIRDGRKLWEVTAERGKYVPQSNTAELEKAELFFHREDGALIKLLADHANLKFSGTQLDNAQVDGSVEMIFNEKVEVRAGNAVYDRPSETVTVPGEVKINTDKISLTGKDLSVNLNTEELILRSDVLTVIQPGAK